MYSVRDILNERTPAAPTIVCETISQYACVCVWVCDLGSVQVAKSEK